MSGVAQNAFTLGKNKVPVEASQDGHYEVESTFKLIKKAKRKRITSAAGGTQLDNIPCAGLLIHNPIGNATVWWGGIGDDVPTFNDAYSGDTDAMPIYEGMYFPIAVDNANKITLIAETDNTEIQYVAYLNRTNNPKIDRTSLVELSSVAPTVLTTNPIDTASDVPLDTTIAIIMDKPIDPLSLDATHLAISPSVSISRYMDPLNSSRILFNPDSDLVASTTYTVTLAAGGVKDLNGNALASQFQFSFTTASGVPDPDLVSPSIVKGSIDNKDLIFDVDNTDEDGGPTDVSISGEVTIDFSEPLDPDFANVTQFFINDNSTVPITPKLLTVRLTNANTRVILTPSENLRYSTLYSIYALGTIQDPSGNTLVTIAPSTSKEIAFFTTEAAEMKLRYNQTGDTWLDLGHLVRGRGVRVTSPNMDGLWSCAPKDVIIRVRRVGNFTSGEPNTMTCAIYDNDLVLKATLAIYTGVTTIDTSLEGENIRFMNTAQVFELDETDMIIITYEGGDSDDYLQVKCVNSDSNPYTNHVVWDAPTNEVFDKTSQELGATVFG